MNLDKALIDTNIFLDALLNRNPFVMPALQLLESSQKDGFKGMVAAHSFNTLFYLANKKFGRKKTNNGIKTLHKAYILLHPLVSGLLIKL